jgi:hypothetical protein
MPYWEEWIDFSIALRAAIDHAKVVIEIVQNGLLSTDRGFNMADRTFS